jgi:hypothetical protein
MADALVKPDPDSKAGASPALLNDDDIYEDAGDLEFNNDSEFQKLYLARVPKYVWEAWHTLDDDAEIRIGTIRQSVETGPDGEQRARTLCTSEDFTINLSTAKASNVIILRPRSSSDDSQGVRAGSYCGECQQYVRFHRARSAWIQVEVPGQV